MVMTSNNRSWVRRVLNLGVTEDCDESVASSRRAFTGAALASGLVAPWWGAMYFAFGGFLSGVIPTAYAMISLGTFALLKRTNKWEIFRRIQLSIVFLLPFALMWSLGGYVSGSAVMIWALFAPIGSIWSGTPKEARFWTWAFLLGAALSGLIEPQLRSENRLPVWMITGMFVLNISIVTGVILYLLASDRQERDSFIDVLRRNRELEEAYLAQEISLRQSDKLATLGKLSAGMAHELNNPSAAVQQGVAQLGEVLRGSDLAELELSALELDSAELELYNQLSIRVAEVVGQPLFLDPLDRTDLETVLQEWLEAHGVENGWIVAPLLVELGIGEEDLRKMEGEFRPEQLRDSVVALVNSYRRQSLLSGLAESTERIIGLVSALKSYTYLDQGAKQAVDVHEGLDATLVMLKHRLKVGVEVIRSYADGLPAIEAYGSELNQVWTNLIDNSIHAMGGVGVLHVSTSRQGESVVVEIVDSGSGISADMVDLIFDPFVTTKGPGEGTGLGLNISHGIVTEKHGGSIAVDSEPGRTVFTVGLPILAASQQPPPAS